MNKFAIIVAGGKGKRMGNSLPKQFMLLHGKPVIIHTIEQFLTAVPGIKLIVVLPQNDLQRWSELSKQYSQISHFEVTAGGSERFYSVKNGLALLPVEGLVAIHDGVRPLVNKEVILNSFLIAEKYGNAIPAVNPRESIRKVGNVQNFPVSREDYKLIQTPQTFRLELIKKAYQQEFHRSFTDDASVYETLGKPIKLIEGNYENIKITHPSDIAFAEALLKFQTAKANNDG